MTAELPKPQPLPRKLLAHTGLDVDPRQLLEWTHDRPDQGVETLTVRVAVLEEPPCPCRRGEPRPEFVQVGTSWVDPSRVVAVVESDISHIRIHLDSGASVPTGIPSSPEAIRLILDTLSNAR